MFQEAADGRRSPADAHDNTGGRRVLRLLGGPVLPGRNAHAEEGAKFCGRRPQNHSIAFGNEVVDGVMRGKATENCRSRRSSS